MKTILTIACVCVFALCTAPAGAQTKKELKLYNNITKRGVTEQKAMKNLVKLQNEELLRRIIFHPSTRYKSIQVTALRKISSQKHLVEIAKAIYDRDMKVEAIKRIESTEDLFQVFLNLHKTQMPNYRYLIRPDMAVRLVMQPDYDVDEKRELIKEHIDDQDMLYKILSDDAYAEIHSYAVRKLTDQKLLTEIAKKHCDPHIVDAASSGITDQNLLWEVVTSEEERTIGKGIKDFGQDMGPWIKRLVAGRITDQSLLMRLVVENGDSEIKREAFAKLDASSLEKLAATQLKGDATAVAARVAAKTSDWNAEINNSRQQIDEVISAMALVPQEAKPTVDNIVAACHKYIRKGDEAKIPDLEFLLNNYGDVKLAEDYLNCGNRRLYDIGADWGRRNGYNIGSGWGSHRATWGSQK